MTKTNYILKKIGEGLLLGIGIAIVMIIAGVITNKVYSNSSDDVINSSYKEFSPEGKLVITEESLVKINDSSAKVIGVIKNDSKLKWGNVGVEVELLDAEGKLIDEFPGYIGVTLKPGESENFKVAITYLKGEEIPVYDHYTIRIVSGFSNNFGN